MCETLVNNIYSLCMEGYFLIRGNSFVGTTFETGRWWYMCLKLRSESFWMGFEDDGKKTETLVNSPLALIKRQVMSMAEVKDTAERNCPVSSHGCAQGGDKRSAVLRIWHWPVSKRSLERGATWLFLSFFSP